MTRFLRRASSLVVKSSHLPSTNCSRLRTLSASVRSPWISWSAVRINRSTVSWTSCTTINSQSLHHFGTTRRSDGYQISYIVLKFSKKSHLSSVLSVIAHISRVDKFLFSDISFSLIRLNAVLSYSVDFRVSITIIILFMS